MAHRACSQSTCGPVDGGGFFRGQSKISGGVVVTVMSDV
jgi:hypothetical protein